MNIFEFENQRFGSDLWTDESIEECRESKPQRKSINSDIISWDDDKYREYQEANWNEYFDFAKTYRFCLFK